jgi:hypothetical protein
MSPKFSRANFIVAVIHEGVTQPDDSSKQRMVFNTCVVSIPPATHRLPPEGPSGIKIEACAHL